MKKMILKKIKKFTASILIIAIVLCNITSSYANIYVPASWQKTDIWDMEESSHGTGKFDRNLYGELVEKATSSEAEPATPSDMEIATPSSAVYDNQIIKIYNIEQLEAIGSDLCVTDSDHISDKFGIGNIIETGQGPLTYSLSATYEIVRDIELSSPVWKVPDDFSGIFVNSSSQVAKELYDQNTDTIFVYNPIQLNLLHSEYGESEPVMSGDYAVNTVGIGTPILSKNRWGGEQMFGPSRVLPVR